MQAFLRDAGHCAMDRGCWAFPEIGSWGPETKCVPLALNYCLSLTQISDVAIFIDPDSCIPGLDLVPKLY